jgi:hypothetical protein
VNPLTGLVDIVAELLAEFAWEAVNDHVGQSSWRWTDLEPAAHEDAVDKARRWLTDAIITKSAESDELPQTETAPDFGLQEFTRGFG